MTQLGHDEHRARTAAEGMLRWRMAIAATALALPLMLLDARIANDSAYAASESQPIRLALASAPAPSAPPTVRRLEERLGHDSGELVGPPAPPRTVPCANDHLSATRGTSNKRGLPFDPLKEPVFAETWELKRISVGRRFYAAGEGPSELHTVHYLVETVHRIQAGETLSELLNAQGLSAKEIEEWLAATNQAHDFSRIRAGQSLSFRIDMRSNRLEKLALEVDPENLLIAERSVDSLSVHRTTIPYLRRLRYAEGSIDSSLSESATAQGVPDPIVSAMADILGWEIDLNREVQRGAVYSVVYEELVRDDTETTKPGRIIAVQLINGTRIYEGFYFMPSDGRPAGYYNRQGHALERRFLRYPVEYTRISSRFAQKRYHPVLKVPRPHYGVDFAAPTGTPVRAIADAEVERAGRYGGNGNFVRLRHDDVYASGYAHLSRIEPGIETGTRVKQGQIIGYVGSTGLATGPHLHFALYENRRYIDPLSARVPLSSPLAGVALEDLRLTIASLEIERDRLKPQPPPEVMTAWSRW